MESDILKKFEEIYEIEAIRVIIFTVCEVALAQNRQYEVHISNLPLTKDNNKVLFSINETLARYSTVTAVFSNENKIISEWNVMRMSIDMPTSVDENIIHDLKILIGEITVQNPIVLYIDEHVNLESLIEILCDNNVKIERDFIENDYKRRTDRLDNKFRCNTKGNINYRRKKEMEVNYNFFTKWILAQPQDKRRRWVVIQNGELCGSGYSRDEAYQQAGMNANYIASKDRYVTNY